MTSKQAGRKTATKCRLKFVPDALREWQALDGSIKQALKPLLASACKTRMSPAHFCIVNWRAVTSGVSRDDAQCASTRKIKLLRQGYRLVCMVEDDALVVLVLSVGKREGSEAYRAAAKLGRGK